MLELQCAKSDGSLPGLRILDEAMYIKPIITKLPGDVQGRWQRHAFRYKTDHGVEYPPFEEFSKFVQNLALERNDPNLTLEVLERENHQFKNSGSKQRQTYKTEIADEEESRRKNVTCDPSRWCVLHEKAHPLAKCRAFRGKSLEDRKNLLRKNRICFRCVASTTHVAKDCRSTVKCVECQSDKHLTIMHAGKPPEPKESEVKDPNVDNRQSRDPPSHGGENEATAKCTELCGNEHGGRSCSKICLANIYAKTRPEKKIKAYVVIDDQSNCTLAKPKLFDLLSIDGEATSYTLKTCAGKSKLEGRCTKNLVIESLDGRKTHKLPPVIECDAIPDSTEEIPTPAVGRAHPHLREIADKIPEIDPEADILLLVGRNVPQLHKVHESRNGKGASPWAQRLDLGWVILGKVCLDGAHQPTDVSSYKTHILPNGRPSILEPCPNALIVKQPPEYDSDFKGKETFSNGYFDDGLARNVFVRTENDDKPGMSVEDRKFVDIMERNLEKNDAGNWTAPLPFRREVITLPESRGEAYKRLKSTRKTLDRNPIMKQHYFAFMKNLFDKGHAEPVPPQDPTLLKPCWYLPHFGIYHPQKPDKIRVVFDSAAENGGISLNKLLLSGPDLTNSLLGVLLRFRKYSTAFMADIEQMFYSFVVPEDHRDFLRFLWYGNNDPDGAIVEYRMKVHIFGNTSSPAIATFGLRKTAEVGEPEFGSDAKEFVDNDFYVDDGLKSMPNSRQAIDLLQRTQAMLATGNLRLHKISSNDPKVTDAFPPDDRAADLRDLDLNHVNAPVQRSLGVSWDLTADAFTFTAKVEEKPFTKRGVLSIINSLYDPLGIAAPVLIQGKCLLRGMTEQLKERQLEEWDLPLPQELKAVWDDWCQSLIELQRLKLARPYATSLDKASHIELHTFGDASVQGIAAVSYLKITQPDGRIEVSFVFGKAKLAPSHATTIPRLELCAAVLAVEITDMILNEHVVHPDRVIYHSDSKVVLGYIANETRRFYVYVTNRVERIRKSSSPSQWCYVSTQHNPADLATRPIKAKDLENSMWLHGPQFLYQQSQSEPERTPPNLTVVQPDDPEVRPKLKTLSTTVGRVTHLETHRFSRFSEWSRLVRAIICLITFVRRFRMNRARKGTAKGNESPPIEQSISSILNTRRQAEIVIIKSLQKEAYGEEIECIQHKKKMAKASGLLKLSPIIDPQGLLCVGGRLEQGELTNEEKHPVILPGQHYVTTLVVEQLHHEIKHQGRHFTQGIIRAKGYWIIGGKRLVNRVIYRCFRCRKQRGRLQNQKMADLPTERLTPAPPFTYVGLDVFGPWQVTTRRTRGGAAQSKRWAVIFTCLTVRAIHIELIESMDTSSFINALRRFFAIRGPAIQLRSDNGTNFVGAWNELGAAFKEINKNTVDTYLSKERCEWVFNPPHGSHMGGVWERMIGIVRKVLNAMLADLGSRHLTHEVLTTLMAEVMAIVNSRPLVPVSTDPTMPEILTPSTLLTQKTSTLKAIPGEFTATDLCKHNKQWRHVQHLANVFWSKWRKEFLPTLQPRRKWQEEVPNLEAGDLVLLRCKDVARNEWPLARVIKAYKSADGKVRKLNLITTRDGAKHIYTRPVTEVVLLRNVHELK